MAPYDAYEFKCVNCDAPLFSSLENRWLRVSNNHITFYAKVQIEALPSLQIADETLSGSKELAECEVQQLFCSDEQCVSRIGVKCVDASEAKKGFM